MKKKFLRQVWRNYSKLGRRRKKKQKYRKAKGVDSKIRLKMKGHPVRISIGFRSEKKKRGLIKGLKPVMIYNLDDLKNLKEKEIAIIAKIGDKKKIEIAEQAQKGKIKLLNLNPEKFLKEIEDKSKKAKEKREARQEKKEKGKKRKKEKKEEKMEREKKETETKEEAVKHESNVKENVEEKK